MAYTPKLAPTSRNYVEKADTYRRMVNLQLHGNVRHTEKYDPDFLADQTKLADREPTWEYL